MKANVVREKSYAFAVEVVQLHRALARKREFVLGRQLMRAGTSVGANVEEALAAQSRRDFASKMSIACKEARESLYWLRLLRDTSLASLAQVDPLLKQADELTALLTAIVKTTRSQPPPNSPLTIQNS